MSFTNACATCPRDTTRSTGSVQEMLWSNLFFHKTPLYHDNYICNGNEVSERYEYLIVYQR
jgi:hypothetical protein